MRGLTGWNHGYECCENDGEDCSGRFFFQLVGAKIFTAKLGSDKIHMTFIEKYKKKIQSNMPGIS